MTATLVTVDAGSSSVKLAAYDLQGGVDDAPIGGSAPSAGYDAQPPRCIARTQAALSKSRSDGAKAVLDAFIGALSGVRAVAHRIVHGGMEFSAPCVVDEATQQALRRLTELAPLHMPIALHWMQVCRTVFDRSVVQIGIFDTAFFAGLPLVARHYAIPLKLQREHGVRRFGFHGLAHASMLRQVRALRPDLDRGGRLVTIQLGAGCSMAAMKHGEPLDTSMGFSPLEGLMMATRAGDIDPGLLTFLERRAGFTAESLERLLNTESGLLGVSGLSTDVRALLKSRSADSELAIDLYCYRIRKYIGSYLAVLGGADVIAIGGGVGEHSPEIRERILDGMDWCGVVLERDGNAARRGPDDGNARISRSTGSVDVWVIAVDEGAEMAREALSVLDATQPRRSQRLPSSST